MDVQQPQAQYSVHPWRKVECNSAEAYGSSARESSLSLPFVLFTPLSLSRWSRQGERTGETLTMERLLGPEEELRSITSVGSGGPDLGRLYSKSLASRLGLREYLDWLWLYEEDGGGGIG